MAIKCSGLKMDICCQSVVVIYLRKKFPQLSEVTATKLSWHQKPGSVPELHFCKAEELTPKCFCKDKKGDLALPSPSPSCLNHLVLEQHQTDGGKKHKEIHLFFYSLCWSKKTGIKTNLTVAKDSNQVLRTLFKICTVTATTAQCFQNLLCATTSTSRTFCVPHSIRASRTFCVPQPSTSRIFCVPQPALPEPSVCHSPSVLPEPSVCQNPNGNGVDGSPHTLKTSQSDSPIPDWQMAVAAGD